jgi:hypothetical protein
LPGSSGLSAGESLSVHIATTLIAVADDDGRKRLFSDEFDETFAVGSEPGNSAFFGQNVLRGLVDGIDDFIHQRQQRWKRYKLAPALLGSALWIDDPVLIDKIGELASACIVVKKQGRKPQEKAKLAALVEVNEKTPGMPVTVFETLTGGLLAPKENGKPTIVGPYWAKYDEPIPTIRTLGYRDSRRNDSPPIIHAKLALLGDLWWGYETPYGTLDVFGFEAIRLWVSSANFTASSRRNLEFGYWTEDPALLDGAKRFLVNLMGSSEALDPESDHFDPELAPVEYDDVAMREALSDEEERYEPDYWDDELES